MCLCLCLKVLLSSPYAHFKHIEPHRTLSKYKNTDRARHKSSGWFKHIEPHRTTSKRMLLERAWCVYVLRGGYRTTSKRMILDRARCVELCRVVQAHRTSSTHRIADRATPRLLCLNLPEPVHSAYSSPCSR